MIKYIEEIISDHEASLEVQTKALKEMAADLEDLKERILRQQTILDALRMYHKAQPKPTLTRHNILSKEVLEAYQQAEKKHGPGTLTNDPEPCFDKWRPCDD